MYIENCSFFSIITFLTAAALFDVEGAGVVAPVKSIDQPGCAASHACEPQRVKRARRGRSVSHLELLHTRRRRVVQRLARRLILHRHVRVCERVWITVDLDYGSSLCQPAKLTRIEIGSFEQRLDGHVLQSGRRCLL